MCVFIVYTGGFCCIAVFSYAYIGYTCHHVHFNFLYRPRTRTKAAKSTFYVSTHFWYNITRLCLPLHPVNYWWKLLPSILISDHINYYTMWIAHWNDMIRLSSLSLHLLHSPLIWHGHWGEFLPYSVMHFHKLSYTAVQANGLAFAQVSLVILWWDALLVTRLWQPDRQKKKRKILSIKHPSRQRNKGIRETNSIEWRPQRCYHRRQKGGEGGLGGCSPNWISWRGA